MIYGFLYLKLEVFLGVLDNCSYFTSIEFWFDRFIFYVLRLVVVLRILVIFVAEAVTATNTYVEEILSLWGLTPLFLTILLLLAFYGLLWVVVFYVYLLLIIDLERMLWGFGWETYS